MKQLSLLLSLLVVAITASATHTVGALMILEDSWASIKNEDAKVYVERPCRCEVQVDVSY